MRQPAILIGLFTMALPSLVAIAAAVVAPPGAIGWRLDGTGSVGDGDYPTSWSVTEGVQWKTKTPAWSNASPIVVGDRIFFCGEPSTLICANRLDGTILWQAPLTYLDVVPEAERAAFQEGMTKGEQFQNELTAVERDLNRARRELQKNEDEEAKARLTAAVATLDEQVKVAREKLAPFRNHLIPVTQPTNGHSSATPVSDGTRVYVFYGTGMAAAYDLDGKRLWARVVERPTHGRGNSALPVLAGNTLVLHILKVHGLDPATGETRWVVPSTMRWGTPVVTVIGGQDVVVTANGELIRATDGTLIAKGLGALTYCAPVVKDEIAYFIEHGGRAVKLPGTTDPETATVEELWKTQPPNERYYASPVVHDGIIYAIMQKSIFSTIDAATGAVIYSEDLKLGGTAYPSITLVGGVLHVSSDSGKTVLVAPGREYRELGRNELENFRSTPLFIDGHMYVRGLNHLYSVGK